MLFFLALAQLPEGALNTSGLQMIRQASTATVVSCHICNCFTGQGQRELGVHQTPASQCSHLPTAESTALGLLGILQGPSSLYCIGVEHRTLKTSSQRGNQWLQDDSSDANSVIWENIWKSWISFYCVCVCVCSNVLFSYLKLEA